MQFISALASFIKKEIVLCISFICALVSTIILKPTMQTVIASIDIHVIALLFNLMVIIAVFRKNKVLDAAAAFMLSKAKSVRGVETVLTVLAFFSSMFVTNDVALLTFVPLSLAAARRASFNPAKIIILQTLAANLGSSLTPMGNPQNLFLYSKYPFTPITFFSAAAGIGIISLFFLPAAVSAGRSSKQLILNQFSGENPVVIPVVINKKQTILFSLLLAVVVLSVFKVVDWKISFALVAACAVITSPKILKSLDYALLATFICFFIFASNISSFKPAAEFLASVLDTPFSVYVTGIAASQIISNVPAAILLSEFTQYHRELLAAVDVGGLGTLIASLASVISYKFYSTVYPEHSIAYLKYFTLYNAAGLLIFIPGVWFILKLV